MDIASRRTSSMNYVDLKSQTFLCNNRIVGAVALLGMLLVNFSVLIGNSSSHPTWLDYLIEMIKGRAAATFVVLAGAGISLLSKRSYLSNDKAEVNAACYLLLKRALFLLIIGLFNFVI